MDNSTEVETGVDSSTAMAQAMAHLNASNPGCAQCLAACHDDDGCAKKCGDRPEPTCEVCPPGSASEGGTTSECKICDPGPRVLLFAVRFQVL
jgi:hypothetical protein